MIDKEDKGLKFYFISLRVYVVLYYYSILVVYYSYSVYCILLWTFGMIRLLFIS